MADEDLPIISESAFNQQFGGGLGEDSDLPVISESQFNSMSAPQSQAPAFLDDPIGYFAGTSNWGVENVVPNLTSADWWMTRPSGENPTLKDELTGISKGIAQAGSDVLTVPADLAYRGGQRAIDAITGQTSDLTGTYPSDWRDSALEYISGGQGNEAAQSTTHLLGNLSTILAAPTQATNIKNAVASYLPKIPRAGALASMLGLGAEGAAQSIYMDPKGNLAKEGLTGAALNVLLGGAAKAAGKLWDTFIPSAGASARGAKKLAGEITDQFREIVPDAFTSGATLEERAMQAAIKLEDTAQTAKKAVGSMFENLPETPIKLDDAIKNIYKYADDIKSPIKSGGTAAQALEQLDALRPVDKLIETPASKVLDEFGNPVRAATKEVVSGGPAVLPLNRVQNVLEDLGIRGKKALGSEKIIIGNAQKEILNAVKESSPEGYALLKKARDEYKTFKNVYDKSAVGAVRKSLTEPGKRLTALKTKLLSDPKSAKELTRVMSPEEISNVRNVVLMDLTSKTPVQWEKTIAKQYDSYKHIFGEEATENLLKMVSREGSVGNKLLKENNGLGSLLAATAARGGIGSVIGYKITGDWKGAAFGALLAGGGGRLEGKVLNQAKSLIMKAAVGSPEAIKILNSIPKTKEGLAQAIKKLAVVLPTTVERETNPKNTKAGRTDLKEQYQPSSNSTTDPIELALNKAEAKLMTEQPPKKPDVFEMSLEEITNTPTEPSENKDFNKLVKAVIRQESKGDSKAESSKGAQGLMQIMPATAKEIASEMGLKDYDIFDRETNQKMGEYYLKKMLKAFDGDVKLALAAYNWGIGNVKKAMKKHGDSWEAIKEKAPQETKAYVRNITKNYIA